MNEGIADGSSAMASNSSTVNNDKFRYDNVPSLQDLSLVSIVTTVVKNNNCTDIVKHKYKEGIESNGVELPIHNLVSQIPLHNSLKIKAWETCKTVAWQMYEWLQGTSKCGCCFDIPLEFINCISWTMDGKLNKPKTLKLMIERNYSNIFQIFELACHFCEEDLVIDTWGKIPHDIRDNLFNWNKEDNSEFQRKCGLVKYWIFYINDNLPELVRLNIYDVFGEEIGINESMINLSILDYNVYAVKYFWNNKLSAEERENNVSEWIESSFDCLKRYMMFLLKSECSDIVDIIFFFLSKLNERNEQIEMLNSFIPRLVVPIMSTFPCQKFFEPMINFIWDTLSEDVYYLLIRTTLQLIGIRNTAKSVFIKLWNQSSREFRKNFAIKACGDCKLYKGGRLFGEENIEILKLFLSYVDYKDKINCIHSSVIDHDFASLILRDINQLKVFDTLVRDIGLTEADIVEFREHVTITIGHDLIRRWMYNDKWQLMDEFLNWGFRAQDDIEKYKGNSKYALETLTIVILFYPVQRYQRADVFLNWCYQSKEDRDKIKFDFACSSVFAFPNWDSFQEFIAWCFENDEEVKQYKLFVSQYRKLHDLLEPKTFRDYDYVDKMLHWFTSRRNIRQFKRKFMLTEKSIIMFEKFIKDYDMRFEDNTAEYCKVVKKLANWYGALGPKVVNRFRKRMRRMKRMVDAGNDYDLFAYLEMDDEKKLLFAICEEFAKCLEKLNADNIKLVGQNMESVNISDPKNE